MHQIKIFTGLEGATEELTSEVNQWLRESRAKVVQIAGNIAPQSIGGLEHSTALPGSGGALSHPRPSDVILIFLYEETHEA